MTRRTEIVQVPPSLGGRDKDKYFKITEWYADDAERWAIKALLAYNRGGGQIDIAQTLGLGMHAVAVLGVNVFLRGQMRAEEVIPILDELLDCVQMVRDPKARDVNTQDIVSTPIVTRDDIEDVKTRMWLRSEVVRVHTGFSPAAAVLTLISAITERPEDSPTTETSLP